MPAIPYAASDGPPDLAALRSRIARPRGGVVPNVYRMLLNSPTLTEGWLELADRVRFRSMIPDLVREHSILLVARLTACAYEWEHHLPLARAAGATAADIGVIEQWPMTGPPETANNPLLRFVAAVATRTPLDRAGVDTWVAQQEPRMVTELTILTAYYLGLAHLIAGLGVDSAGEGTSD